MLKIVVRSGMQGVKCMVSAGGAWAHGSLLPFSLLPRQIPGQRPGQKLAHFDENTLPY